MKAAGVREVNARRAPIGSGWQWIGSSRAARPRGRRAVRCYARAALSDPSGPILVTGANGQLGRRLIRRLSRRAPPRPRQPVRALVRSERAARSIETLCRDTGTDLAVVDYADAAALTRAAAGGDAIVHLVGILKETNANRYADAHERTSEAIAAAADAAGLRRIVALSILGSHPAARNACLASKGRAEEILLRAKTPAVVIRVPMVIGAGDPASQALLRQATSGRASLVRGGATRDQPIAADDVVEAIAAALAKAGLEDVALDLAGPESLSHRALVERAAAVLGRQVAFRSVPLALARAFAFLAGNLMSDPPLTPAMLGVLEHDDDIDPEPARRALGIALTPLDEALRRGLLAQEADA
jgi:NADH dehydrogenase